ncbi:hypothetical protein DSH45_13070 [Escherichia coli]|nr:hypothetical protein [Escherichia coli]EGO9480189.1 hypothetical protein [Escherichia coli]
MYCVVCLQACSCRSYAILPTAATFNVKYVNKTLHYCPEVEDSRYGGWIAAFRLNGRNKMLRI